MNRRAILFSLSAKRVMRNLVLLPFVAFLSLAGCQVDQMDADLSDSIEQKLVIRATYESPDIDTKTMRDGSGKIYWVPGDAISLFYGSGTAGGSKFVAMTDTVALVTNFSGTITLLTRQSISIQSPLCLRTSGSKYISRPVGSLRLGLIVGCKNGLPFMPRSSLTITMRIWAQAFQHFDSTGFIC